MRHKWSLCARRTRPLRPGTPSGPPNSLSCRLDEVGGLWGAGQSLPEPASPALLPDSKRHAHTPWGEECPARLSQMAHTLHTHTKRRIQNPKGRTHRHFSFTGEVFHPVETVVITLLTFSIHTAKQKQLMGGASWWGASRLAVGDTSNPLLRRFCWSRRLKPQTHLTPQMSIQMGTAYLGEEQRVIGQLNFLSCHEELFLSFHWTKHPFFTPDTSTTLGETFNSEIQLFVSDIEWLRFCLFLGAVVIVLAVNSLFWIFKLI